jgi:hypothetical protein
MDLRGSVNDSHVAKLCMGLCGLVDDPHIAKLRHGLVDDPHMQTSSRRGLVDDPCVLYTHCGLVDDPHVQKLCRGLVDDPCIKLQILVHEDPGDDDALIYSSSTRLLHLSMIIFNIKSIFYPQEFHAFVLLQI